MEDVDVFITDYQQKLRISHSLRDICAYWLRTFLEKNYLNTLMEDVDVFIIAYQEKLRICHSLRDIRAYWLRTFLK